MTRDFSLGDSSVLLERAERHLAGPSTDPVQPRLAATVILVRDAGQGPVEVFLMWRTATMEFAPSTIVFPGGAVDRRDARPDLPWAGPSVTEWARRLRCDPVSAQLLVAAAVRELFEESGVLLASRADAGPQARLAEVSDPSWDEMRVRLVEREVGLAEVLITHGLALRSDLLVAHAHWITPPFERRRYDTHFFAAAMPAGQEARHLSTEADEADWADPARVVADYAAGRAVLLPPTLVCLEELAAAESAAAYLAGPRQMVPIMPVLAREADGSVVLRVAELGSAATADVAPRGGRPGVCGA
ncbi:MAG TPA: hypothetical protein VHM65_09370 [Candidatus Lustribacter sp.]|nr:hypothetical protein [Candidatus Lustribacter sp.]